MGIEKHEHIAKLVQLPEIQTAWQKRYNRLLTPDDELMLFDQFETFLLKRLATQTELTPFVLETQAYLHQNDIKIATTTGYTRPMLELVAQQASQLGYQPDLMVSKEDVQNGRPSPDMIHKIQQTLKLNKPQIIIKVGDTVVDMLEGRNAGVITIGVLESSSLIGLTATELAALTPTKRQTLISEAKKTLLAAGAADVINNLSQLPAFIATKQSEA